MIDLNRLRDQAEYDLKRGREWSTTSRDVLMLLDHISQLEEKLKNKEEAQAQRTPLSDDDVGLWIVRTLGAASKQGKYSAISNCVPLGAELVPFFLEFARDHGITQEKHK